LRARLIQDVNHRSKISKVILLLFLKSSVYDVLHDVLDDVFFVTFKETDDSNLRFYEEILTKGDDMQALQGSEFYQNSILASLLFLDILLNSFPEKT